MLLRDPDRCGGGLSPANYAQLFSVVSLTAGLAWRRRITTGSHEDDDRPRTH